MARPRLEGVRPIELGERWARAGREMGEKRELGEKRWKRADHSTDQKFIFRKPEEEIERDDSKRHLSLPVLDRLVPTRSTNNSVVRSIGHSGHQSIGRAVDAVGASNEASMMR